MKFFYKSIFVFICFLFCCSSNAQSTKTLDSLNLILKNAKHDTTRVEALIAISEEQNISPDSILIVCNRAIELIQNNLHTKNKTLLKDFTNYRGIALNNLGGAYYYMGDRKNAFKYSNEALKILQQVNNQKYISNCLSNLGSFYDDVGDWTKALQYKNKSLRILKAIKNEKEIALCLNNIGYTYDLQGNSAKALNFYYKSLQIAEQIKDNNNIAQCFNNIAGIIENQGNLEEALKYYQKSLKLVEAEKYYKGIKVASNNISRIYFSKGDSAKALEINLRNLIKAKEVNDKEGVALALNNIGLIYSEQKKYSQALYYSFKSLKLSKEIQSYDIEITSLLIISDIYIKQKKYNIAENYCLEAYKIANTYKNATSIMDASWNLMKVYKKQEKFKEAFQMHLVYKEIFDSIRNDEGHRTLIKNQLQYEFEKKELELKQQQTEKELVNQQIVQRKNYWIYGSLGTTIFIGFIGILFYCNYKQKQKNALQQNIVLEQKLLRSQMNPHFIFNSLGIIQNYIRNNKSDRAEEYLIEFSKLMRLILENSREEYVPLEKEIETLTYYLSLYQLVLQNSFSYKIHVDESIDTAITCVPPMLAQPFIENALKHGVGDKKDGKLMINFKNAKESILFEVSDNGIGYSRSQELKKERAGKHVSLATQIVYERLENINKHKKKKIQISISDIVDHLQQVTGTKVQFEIPVVYDT